MGQFMSFAITVFLGKKGIRSSLAIKHLIKIAYFRLLSFSSRKWPEYEVGQEKVLLKTGPCRDVVNLFQAEKKPIGRSDKGTSYLFWIESPTGTLHCEIESPTGTLHCEVESPTGTLHCEEESPTGTLHCEEESPMGRCIARKNLQLRRCIARKNLQLGCCIVSAWRDIHLTEGPSSRHSVVIQSSAIICCDICLFMLLVGEYQKFMSYIF
ncbi:hypothetical protein C0J52_09398 [Blattella germanica]|nr:hypothetical protein C0J52_09398 [Blattella germanica]